MDSSNPSVIDMRHTKLNAEEAALIAGELVKPSWASRNEGIHERISFEDTLWGFELAGGSYYKTHLRVAYVKPGSRAEMACVRLGDQVLRINGVDTSTLTLDEAHKLVLEAGINLKLVVTSPDDRQDAYYKYEDTVVTDPPLTPEQLKALEKERIEKAIAKAIRCRDLQWPWVRRKIIIYRESNCFMVPSKYEDKHRDHFPELPSQKFEFFYPMDQLDKLKPESKKKDNSNSNDKDILNGTEDDAELEEEEEVLEDENEIAEKETEDDDETPQTINTDERLQNKTEGDHEASPERKDSMFSLGNESSVNDLEQELENPIKDDLAEANRKGSDQGYISSYEVDNNNNVVVSKNENEEVNDEPRQNTDNAVTDDNIINEIVENANEVNGEDNVMKSDDEIIDSVLNNAEFEDTLNER